MRTNWLVVLLVALGIVGVMSACGPRLAPSPQPDETQPPGAIPSEAATTGSVATSVATLPASVSETSTIALPSATSAEGTPEAREDVDLELIEAAGQGDLEAVQRLLQQGASVDAQDEFGRTALVAAAYSNHLDVVDALIAAGADVNTKDDTQQSAYLISTSEGYVELLQRTLQAGADVHSLDSYNGTGLIRAADRGHVEIIRELLKTDININHVNRLGWTALLEAIILGDGGERHTEVVRLLVEAGADVNLADGSGSMPLAHARQRGYAEIAAILEKAGAR